MEIEIPAWLYELLLIEGYGRQLYQLVDIAGKFIDPLLCCLYTAVEIWVKHLGYALPKHLCYIVLDLAELVYCAHNRFMERLLVNEYWNGSKTRTSP